MGSRGPQSFKKRQKEQQRKEKQMEKAAKRLDKGKAGPSDGSDISELDSIALARLEAENLDRINLSTE